MAAPSAAMTGPASPTHVAVIRADKKILFILFSFHMALWLKGLRCCVKMLPALLVELLVIGLCPGPGVFRYRLGLDGLEPLYLHHMGVMAFGADPPPLLIPLCPVAYPLAVHPGPPVAVYLAVAFSAEPLRLVEAYLLSQGVYECVPVSRVVAVQTPDRLPAVLKVHRVLHYVLVHHEKARLFVLRIGDRLPVVAARTGHEPFELLGPRLYHRLLVRVGAFHRHLPHGLGAVEGGAEPQHTSRGLRALYVIDPRLNLYALPRRVSIPALEALGRLLRGLFIGGG